MPLQAPREAYGGRLYPQGYCQLGRAHGQVLAMAGGHQDSVVQIAYGYGLLQGAWVFTTEQKREG